MAKTMRRNDTAMRKRRSRSSARRYHQNSLKSNKQRRSNERAALRREYR